MDYHCDGFPGGSAIKNKCENTVTNINENWGTASTNQAVSAIEEVVWDTKTYSDTKLKPTHKAKLFQFEAENQPPNKRARKSLLPDWMASDRSKAIGEIFYKTKLCCEFVVGTCPFINNCNYAHGIEELRELPPNLEEIVAAHEEQQLESLEPTEVFQNPGFVDEAPLSEEVHQYGENCYSTHNEQYEDRVSEAICLLPGTGSKSKFNASNWKTRICNKWELTGWCPFGGKCRFAHGFADLRGHGRVLVNTQAGDSSTFDAKQTATALPAKASIGTVDMPEPRPITCVPRSYHAGAPSRSLPNVIQKKTGEIPTRRWKGPDKISKIYGDWIDDL